VSQVKTKKSPTSEERWGFLGLINGGAAHPFKLAFGGEGNGPVTSDIRANPGGWGRQGDPPVTRASQDWMGENVTGED